MPRLQGGEAAEGLRMAQHVIDCRRTTASTTDDFVVGSPLARWSWLARHKQTAAWECLAGVTDLDDAATTWPLGRSDDAYAATIMFKYVIPMHNGAVLPDAAAHRGNRRDALTLAERSSDDFALDGSISWRAVPVLVNSRRLPDRARGFRIA